MIQKLVAYPIARKVLAVAVLNNKEFSHELFDWAVYIDAVPGANHCLEMDKVAVEGCKQNRDMAALLFPELDINKYRD